MNDPFFISGGGARKRKAKTQGKPAGKEAKGKAKGRPEPVSEDDHSNSEEEDRPRPMEEDESEESDHETAAEKKVRLAKEYIGRIMEQEASDESDVERDRDSVAHRLRQEHMESEGKIDRNIAHKYTHAVDSSRIRRLRGHQLAVTCVALTHDERFAFSASKDCSIIKWDVETGKKLAVAPGGLKDAAQTHNGHTDHILAIAVSTDGRYLASGGREKIVFVWDTETLRLLKKFNGHRDCVTALAFRRNTHTLFSGSMDRTLKLWNLDEMAYIETLYGHQDAVTGVDSLAKERAMSVGGRDRTMRLWKIVEESQLIFNGHTGNTECVRMVNENMSITCGEDGTINLWTLFKKKPVHTVHYAHAVLPNGKNIEEERAEEEANGSGEEEESKKGRNPKKGNKVDGIPEVLKGTTPPWVTSLAVVTYTDSIASGSHTGFIKLWQITAEKTLKLVQAMPMDGYVNGLAFSPTGKFLVAAIGQEHRMGRWEKIKGARNGLRIIPLVDVVQSEEEDGDGDVDGELRVDGEEGSEEEEGLVVGRVVVNGDGSDSEGEGEGGEGEGGEVEGEEEEGEGEEEGGEEENGVDEGVSEEDE